MDYFEHFDLTKTRNYLFSIIFALFFSNILTFFPRLFNFRLILDLANNRRVLLSFL